LVLGEKPQPDSYTGTLHYMAKFRFLIKLKDFQCSLWSKKYRTKA